MILSVNRMNINDAMLMSCVLQGDINEVQLALQMRDYNYTNSEKNYLIDKAARIRAIQMGTRGSFEIDADDLFFPQGQK